jgi:hypothetical protein
MLDDEPVIPHKYDKFRHTNGVAYAFLEVPIELLNQQMPDYANWAVIKDDEGQPIEIKTLGEYAINVVISVDNTKAVIALAAMQAPVYRTPALTYDDLQDWEDWLDLLGYNINEWLTIAERAALLATNEYGEEGE